MSKRTAFVMNAMIIALLTAAQQLRAEWPENGTAVCTTSSDQYFARIISDGSGGAIIAWEDFIGEYLSGTHNIYAQRINASGDALWTPGGVAICAVDSNQFDQRMVSDGSGGAIIVWTDDRSTDEDIYAQRVDSYGNALWTAGGIAVCKATASQWSPEIATDGGGGGIIVWIDARNGNDDLYAQRLDASGSALWTADGIALCTAANDQLSPEIISDDAGGAIIVWRDERSGVGLRDIFAQRIDGTGAALWTAGGDTVCIDPAWQWYPTIASDGANGAIIAWVDNRAVSHSDIYAQRMDASGSVVWATAGIAVCTDTEDQNYPEMISDGTGGAIIIWGDTRGTGWSIYAQRVNTSGTMLWTTDGIPVCDEETEQEYRDIITDATGGCIITWADARNGYLDVFAQRLDGSGSALWAENGVALCTAADYQHVARATVDGMGGAIVTWFDKRSGSGYDVYAQRIDRSGYIRSSPIITGVLDVPHDQGGVVTVTWLASSLDAFPHETITRYSIWRRLSETAAMRLASNTDWTDWPELVTVEKNDALPMLGADIEAAPVYRLTESAGTTYGWELLAYMDAYYRDIYTYTASTLFDSSATTNGYHHFMVTAHTADHWTFWDSAPDSGYSIDNLAPSMPGALAGQQSFEPAGLHLTWDENTEPDLSRYAIYRGTSEGFISGPGNLIASPVEAEHFDGEWRWDAGYHYKVSAIDVHGNESPVALLGPNDVTGEETPKVPEASFLAQNHPNPFNPVTTIHFGLHEPRHASLRVYDAGGRLVRVLLDDDRAAGVYTVFWNGIDGNGATVASGVYFYRLTTGDFMKTRKMVLLR